MKKITTFFLVCFLTLSLSTTSLAAATSDFLYTPEDATGLKEGYDKYLTFYYGNNFYILYFNDEDLQTDTYTEKSTTFTLTFEKDMPHEKYRSSVDGFMHLFYGGVSDCSSLVLQSLGGTDKTGSPMYFSKTDSFFTNSVVLSDFLKEKGYTVKDSWYLYFDDSLGYDYTVYSISSTESGEVVCSFSKLGTSVTITSGTIKISSGYLYNAIFDTLENAENYMRTGSTDGLIRCTAEKSLSGVSEIHYSNFNITDGSNNLVFSSYPIGSLPEGDDITNGGLLTGFVGAINNLGANLATFFQSIIDILSFPVDLFNSCMEDLSNYFGFIKNLITFKDYFLDFLTKDHFDPVPITINLSNGESSIYGSGKITVLDLSFYTKTWISGICLKDIGDLVISAYLWSLFLWNLFCNIPSVFSGSPTMVQSKMDFDDWRSKKYGPRRITFNKNRRMS